MKDFGLRETLESFPEDVIWKLKYECWEEFIGENGREQFSGQEKLYGLRSYCGRKQE